MHQSRCCGRLRAVETSYPFDTPEATLCRLSVRVPVAICRKKSQLQVAAPKHVDAAADTEANVTRFADYAYLYLGGHHQA